MNVSPVVLVAAGGAVGAVLRFLVGRALPADGWPWGTLAVNVVGGFAMGLLAGWLATRGAGEGWRLLLGVGLLGGFTTFSAFSLEMLRLIEGGAVAGAFAYAAVSVFGALAAVWAGQALARGLA